MVDRARDEQPRPARPPWLSVVYFHAIGVAILIAVMALVAALAFLISKLPGAGPAGSLQIILLGLCALFVVFAPVVFIVALFIPFRSDATDGLQCPALGDLIAEVLRDFDEQLPSEKVPRSCQGMVHAGSGARAAIHARKGAITIGDAYLRGLSRLEVKAVVAHEVGHFAATNRRQSRMIYRAAQRLTWFDAVASGISKPPLSGVGDLLGIFRNISLVGITLWARWAHRVVGPDFHATLTHDRQRTRPPLGQPGVACGRTSAG